MCNACRAMRWKKIGGAGGERDCMDGCRYVSFFAKSALKEREMEEWSRNTEVMAPSHLSCGPPILINEMEGGRRTNIRSQGSVARVAAMRIGGRAI